MDPVASEDQEGPHPPRDPEITARGAEVARQLESRAHRHTDAATHIEVDVTMDAATHLTITHSMVGTTTAVWATTGACSPTMDPTSA